MSVSSTPNSWRSNSHHQWVFVGYEHPLTLSKGQCYFFCPKCSRKNSVPFRHPVRSAS